MFNLKSTLLICLTCHVMVNNIHAQPCIKQTLKPDQRLLHQIEGYLDESVTQYKYLMELLPDGQLPRTYENGQLLTTSPYGWVSGFYPGTLLYLYEFAADSTLLNEIHKYLNVLEPLQMVTNHHDLGFMMYCSFGNAYRLFHEPRHRDILAQSAQSLASRFYPSVGSIKSWEKVKSLDGTHTLEFPVIIDNMMNLELLFFASKITNDPRFREIAISHAENTIRDHLRPDYSSYHVVNYDVATGKVLSRETQQGYAHNSAWSRGQAWGIYGFTMTYRETAKKKYLKVAQKMADYFINHENLPEDKIPYWDFHAEQPGYTPPQGYNPGQYEAVPRDASAAAIVASALIELASYVDKKTSKKYLGTAEQILQSLSAPSYRAAAGTNGGFLLQHSSGGVPGNIEVDVPLCYADYYYVEALMRYRKLGNKRKIDQ